MFNCQKFWLLLATVFLLESHQSLATPVSKIAAPPTSDISNSALISTDIIQDKKEKDTTKVIRVSTLNLPPLKEDADVLNKDSSVYKIQTLQPYAGQRKYMHMQRFKQPNEEKPQLTQSNKGPAIIGLSVLPSQGKFLKPKHQSRKKHLHFLYNQKDLAGDLLTKSTRVHVAPGAYPVYYVVAKTNGHFGKYPLKSFGSPQAFTKYLQKNKVEEVPILEKHEMEV